MIPVSVIIIFLTSVFIHLVIRYRYLLQYHVHYLLIVIGVNLIAELTAYYLSVNHIKGGSAWVYNFSMPTEMICYGLVFKKIYKKTILEHLINFSIVGILGVVIGCFFYYKSIFPFYTPVLTTESVFLLVITLMFFVKLFKADYFHVNPLKQFFFWLSMGLLLCYLGSFMFLSNLNYLFIKFQFLYANLKYLNFILNCFLYISIIIGVECLRYYSSFQIRSFSVQ